jgi:hypothetical protein
MARVALISLGALLLALATAVASLEAFTASHPSPGRAGGSLDRPPARVHASMMTDCERGLTGGR